MKIKNQLFIFAIQLLVLLLIVSCKKDKTNKPESVNTPTPVIAPCELEENVLFTSNSTLADSLPYINDTILFNDPAFSVENCQYYIKKETADSNSNLHLYFTEEPITGKYLSSEYDDYLEANNRVLIHHDLGAGFVITSTGNNSDTIYVNNEDGIITVSFCDLHSHLWGIDPVVLKCSARITIEK